jgi:peptide/nickel transport system substrate-binding protein
LQATKLTASNKLLPVMLLFLDLVSATFLPAFAQTIQHGGTLTLALPNTLDNWTQFLTASYEAWYFLQLAYPNPGIPLSTGIMHVAVLNYWSNDQANTWYFRIRPGMTWSDGVPVTAADLEYSIRLMFSKYNWGGIGSLYVYQSYLASTITDSIHAVNSTVVEVDLNRPLGTLGDAIGSENTPNLTPYHIWKDYINNGTGAPGNNFGTLVGAGAFYISNFTLGDTQVVLLPNPYGSPFGGDEKGIPYLDKIIVKLVASSASTSLMIKGGEIDAGPVSAADVAGLTSDPRFKVAYGPRGADTWILEYPIFNYPYNMSDFRKALAYAINRTDLVQVAYSGYGVPGSEGYLPQSQSLSIPQYDYNPQLADQLISGLGWTKHSDGFYYMPNGTMFSPTIYAPAELQPQVATANRIAQFLRAIGINAVVQSISLPSMLDIWEKGTNMYLYEQNYGYPPAALLFDYSFDGSATGIPVMQPVFWPTSIEAEYNNTLTQMQATGNEAARNQILQKLEGMIAENLPSITLYYVDSVWVYNTENFGGWPTPPSIMEWPGGEFNMTALATIYSLSAQTSSTTTAITPSGVDYTPYLIGGVIVVIALLAVGMYTRKKRA